MRIVWDEPKRLANIAKHGLDFIELEGAFDLDEAVIRPADPAATAVPAGARSVSLTTVSSA